MGAPLAQSADKKDLFARLGLTEQTHKILLQEAQLARDSLSRNPVNLTEQSRQRPPREPYKWDEISETAKHREILTIVNNAPPHTRYYYEQGRYYNVNEENWVARWYLWHSFRYRDNRESRSKTTTSSENDGYAGVSASYAGGSVGGRGYYDAARGEYRSH
ncbi:hypothetical protein BKA63DRAFT_561413 [Paraphoma chrysanthemicola]|nr:hypothetical protein BKA63DRAFT_561413 [Paraphoma chrysanthemicola]